MHTSIFQRALVTLSCFFFLSACHAPLAQSNSSISVPLEQNTSEEFAPLSPEVYPSHSETDEEIWDVSDVDISDVDKTRKLLSFTFDDAPSRSLERILAVFAAFNESNPDCPASATFFLNGIRFDSNTPHTLTAALTLGMELGNHSYTHYDLTTLEETKLRTEIDETDKLLCAIDGRERHLFRAPFGKVNELVRSVVHTPIFDWTIDTLDWTGISENEIYEKVWSDKYPGAIVLMHDGYENTVSALKRLLPDLKEAGYQVTSISKMAKAHDCPLRKGSVYIRARKNGVGT